MNYFRLGLKITITLFLMETIILILFYFTPSPTVAHLGYSFIIVSVIISWGYTAVLLFNFLLKKIKLKETLMTIGALIANILVLLLYVYLAALLREPGKF